MIKSGITITEAIDILATQTKSAKFHHVLTEILKDIRNGKTLAQALRKHPKVFDQFYSSLIEVGEESGTLDNSLDYLAKQLAKAYGLHKKIQGALLYPAIVVSAMLVIGLGMSFFVLPKLVNLFSVFDVKLPITTRILLFFATLMKNHGPLVTGGSIAAFLFLRFILELPLIKPKWHLMKLSFPIFGRLYENEQLTAFCRNLGIMLKTGLTITKSLQVQYAATENLVFKEYVKRLQKSVDSGTSIEDELSSRHYSKFSPIAVRMIGVGEKTGKLDEVLLYLGDFFEDELDDTAKNLSVVLEPILLLIIGLLVGFVAFAIITPIYQITGSIK